jgi:Spy/CpxP family protein refolding chaperone
MTRLLRVALGAVALAASAWAAGPDLMDSGPPGGPPPFLKRVFTPKTVMAHQLEIGLRPAQIEAIKKAMNETQQQLVDLQWKLDAATEALDKLLEPDHVDEAAVLAKLDEVTAIERSVKRVNFTLLVRIKNQLDPDQQAKLRTFRPPRGPGGPPPGPPPD